MRVVVPGASGQLGKEVVAQLLSLGETVIPLTRQEMDLNLKETIFTCINDLSPDVVINCAAYTQVDQAESDPEAAYTVNQRSVRELALISRGIKAVFVHISTDFVFDGSKSCPYTEEDHPYPVNVYGASKLAGEKELLDLCPHSLLLRTSWLYSHEGHNFVQTMLRLAKEREIIRVVDDQIGSPTCVKDLAQVILTLLKNEVHGMFHVSNEGVASWYDFALAVIEESRRQGIPSKARTITPVPSEDFPTLAKRPFYSVLSKRKIRPYLETPLPHWRESLRKTICRMTG